MRYYLARDNSGHWYVVPDGRRSDWVAWTLLPEDDERAWDAPDWAQRVNGAPGLVTFTDPVID